MSTIPQYIVNLQEVEVLPEYLGTGNLELVDRESFYIFEDFTLDRREISIPLKGKGYIYSIEIFGLTSFPRKVKIEVDNLEVLDSFLIRRCSCSRIDNLEFDNGLLKIIVDEGIRQEKGMVIVRGFRETKSEIFTPNCTITLDDEVRKIRVPYNSSYTFNPPAIYNNKKLFYAEHGYTQKLDRYGFNITKPELGRELVFNFVYGGL